MSGSVPNMGSDPNQGSDPNWGSSPNQGTEHWGASALPPNPVSQPPTVSRHYGTNHHSPWDQQQHSYPPWSNNSQNYSGPSFSGGQQYSGYPENSYPYYHYPQQPSMYNPQVPISYPLYPAVPAT